MDLFKPAKKTPAKEGKKKNFCTQFMESVSNMQAGLSNYFTQLIGGPEGVYKKFATAVADGKHGSGVNLVVGPTAKAALKDKEESYYRCRGALGYQFREDAFQEVEKEKLPDGSFRVKMLQVIRHDAPGVTSVLGAVKTPVRHEATLEKTSSGWKIKSFRWVVEPMKDRAQAAVCM